MIVSKRHKSLVITIKNYYPSLEVLEEFYLDQKLRLDIYLPHYRIGIEVDGIQHSQYVEFLHKSDKTNFEIQKMLDDKKTLMCQQQSIYLYRVKHNDKREDLDILMDIFSSRAKVSLSEGIEKLTWEEELQIRRQKSFERKQNKRNRRKFIEKIRTNTSKSHYTDIPEDTG